MIDWNIVAIIAAPLVTLFVGAALTHAIERRPRLVTYLGYVAAHRVTLESGVPFDVYTHSVVLKNAGRRAARNVCLTHSILPNFSVCPSIKYRTEQLPSGEIDIVFPVLVPGQEMTISYLYLPPTTWDKVNGPVKSDDGHAKVIRVLPAIQHPAWVNAIVSGLVLVGITALLYCVVMVFTPQLVSDETPDAETSSQAHYLLPKYDSCSFVLR